MALMDSYDLSDSQAATDLLALENDCLKTAFVDLAEDGYLVKFPVAPHLARLLEDERYLRKHRQGRLVTTLRALYLYKDKSVASTVARYLNDPNEKVREVSARTLGKLTGHTFSRMGDMDFTPPAFYLAKARSWWFYNKNRPEYNSAAQHLQRPRTPEPEYQDSGDFLHAQIARLQQGNFPAWASAFGGLLEYGVEHDPASLITLLESTPTQGTDSAYTETLIRLIRYYNDKRNTTSEYDYKTNYDVREFCPQ